MATCIEQRIRVLIVDDHPIVRDGLAARIERQPDLEVCGEAESETEGIERAQETMPDVVVVDLSLKSGSGLELIKRIRSRFPWVLCLVSSMHDEKSFAERAMRAGAVGYVNKQQSGRKIIDAIRQVHSGNLFFTEVVEPVAGSPIDSLSDRELEVFELIGEGCSPVKIGERLNLKTKTVETYRDRIRVKLDLATGAELTRYATQWYLQDRT